MAKVDGQEQEEQQETTVIVETQSDPTSTVETAAEVATTALLEVKQIEVQALAEVTSQMTTIMGQLVETLEAAREHMREAEMYKLESLDILESLQQNDETESSEKNTPPNESLTESPTLAQPILEPSNSQSSMWTKLKQGAKDIL